MSKLFELREPAAPGLAATPTILLGLISAASWLLGTELTRVVPGAVSMKPDTAIRVPKATWL
jgi:hypothetical protein